MAVTSNSYTGNGSTTQYSITFQYIATTDIKAQINGVATTAFSLANATTLQFNSAPANGAAIVIYRETDDTNIPATFFAGSSIRSQDLNDNFTQTLFIGQETSDRSLSTLGGTMSGDVALGQNAKLIFEGSTDDAHETTLTVTNPTADREIVLPNVSGTVVTTGDSGTVTSTMIADGTIATGDLANSSVTTAKIGDGQITSAKIANAGILTADIADGQVTNAKLANNNVINTAQLQANVVTTAKIADDAVTTAKIADDAVTTDQIAVNSISTDRIQDNAVTTAKIADSQITSAKIANATILTANIADGQISQAKLANNDVIATAQLQDNVVTTAKIADSQITSAKIANASILTADIADGQITQAKLANSNVINTAQIQDNAVTVAKIADAELSTLAGMQSGTASVLASSTALTSTTAELNQLDGKTITSSFNGGNSNDIPTSSAINSHFISLLDSLGGFVAISNEVSFPNANPDPSDNAGTVVSIQDAGGVVVNGSGVSTTGRTVGGSTVTINGFPSSLHSKTLASGLGLQVQTTSTLNTYTYHKLIAKEADVEQLSTDINDFAARYRVGSNNPTTDLDNGDLFFNTGTGKMLVYNSNNTAWEEVQSVGNFFINTISSYSGTGGNSATFNGTAWRFTLSNAPTNAEQLLVSINGVVQKPTAGTSQPAEGFSIDGSSILFSSAPPSGSDWFIITIGSAVNIGTPSNNTVSTAIIQNGAVTTDKLGADAVTEAKLSVSNNPTNGYFLSAQAGNTGGLTWAAAPTPPGGAVGVAFNDNVKARFGALYDLEIFHDGGSNNYIKVINDNQDITIESTKDLYLKTGDGSTGTHTAIYAADNAGVVLKFDNATKFETTSSGVRMPDTAQFELGAGSDLKMWHSGSHSFIRNETGNLTIEANGAGDDAIKIIPDGAVEAYYDNVKRFETTSAGISISGTIEASGNLDLPDWGQLKLGTDDDLLIYHNGSKSYIADVGTGSLRINSNDFRVYNAADSELMIKAVEDGSVDLYHNNLRKLSTDADGIAVHAEEGAEALIYLTADQGDDNTDKWLMKATNSGGYHIQNFASGSWENNIVCSTEDKVSLYFDNSEKFETTSTGTKTTGYAKAFLVESDSAFGSTDAHVLQSNNNNQVGTILEHSGDSHPYGLVVSFSDSSPDGHNHYFIKAEDSTTNRFLVYADGDVWNHDDAYTGSDQTLKENIVDATPKLEDLKKLKVRNFNWKADYFPEKSKQKQLGFIAQEVEQVFPSLVSEHDIAPGTPGDDHTPVMKKAIKQAWDPIIIKAMQELIEKVETLETKVAALEAK